MKARIKKMIYGLYDAYIYRPTERKSKSVFGIT